MTIADGSDGGTITPSVGSPGTSSVTVTPSNGATGFTFTYNAASAGAKTLTFTNSAGLPESPSSLSYTAGSAGAATAFSLPTGSVLHYMAPSTASPAGNDGNSGLDAAHPWRTPNHAMKCGEVIIAAAGNYTGGWQDGEWGAVSTCPSTTGGIDGAGGIQFAVLLCDGNIGTCTQDGGAFEAFRINVSHWAVEGWWGTQNTNAQGACFSAENDVAAQNYVAFINDIASVCDLAGFGASGGGGSAGTSSFDHIAAVGVVAFDAANSISAFCGSGISFIPGNSDGATGTHIFVDQYFGAYNSNRLIGGNECNVSGNPSFPHSDGEGLIFDTYAAGYTTAGFTGQVVARNSVIWHSGNSCIQTFPQGNGTTNDKTPYIVHNVSCYANNQDDRANCAAELFFNQIYPTATGSYTYTDNLVVATQAKCGGAGAGNNVSGVEMDSHGITLLTSPPIAVQNNYIFQSNPGSVTVVGPPNTQVHSDLLGPNNDGFNAPWIFGTNTYVNPGFTDPTTLFSTTPDCTGYVNVALCMNTGLGVAAKIAPTVASTTLGYQVPSTTCASSDPEFPTWLKGIVYLHWTGTAIEQRHDLATTPCGL